MFSSMCCDDCCEEGCAAELDTDDSLTGAALEAVSAPAVLTSLEVRLDEVSGTVLLPPLLAGLSLLVSLELPLLGSPELPLPTPLVPSVLLGGVILTALLLLETSSDEVGDAPASDDGTGSGVGDFDGGVGSLEVEGGGASDDGAGVDADDSPSGVEEEGAGFDEDLEAVEVVEGSGSGDEEGAGEAEEGDDEDEPPERQLESLELSTGTPCLYLKSPVESFTWKIKVSEPAGTLTFQVVELPWRPLRVSRVVEPT